MNRSRANKASRVLVTALLSAMLVLPVPQKAYATAIEYTLVVALIAFAADIAFARSLPDGSSVLFGQLEVAVEGARTANMADNRIVELSRLSKAIGAAEALLGMTSACDDCDELRGVLQEVIGDAAALKASAAGTSGTCHPNGVLEPNEQCDPRATPTGCPVTTELTYCSDECRCVPAP